MMGKRKWFMLIVLLGVAFITFTIIGKEKKISEDVLTVEKTDDIVPYFKSITPGLELAIKSGGYQAYEGPSLPKDFKINVDGVWYSRNNVYVFYHVDVSDTKFVITRDREDLPKIDQLVMEEGSGKASVLELVETGEGVLFEDDYYMKGTFQAVTHSETNEPLQKWNGALKAIVSGKRSATVEVPVSYEYEKEEKITKQINETKKFVETIVTVSQWEKTPSDSRLILNINSPLSKIVDMNLMISTNEKEIAPLIVEEISGQYSVSFPRGTELPEAIQFYGLIGASSKEIIFEVDPNQYEIYKQIKEPTYTHQVNEPIAKLYGAEIVKETLYYDDYGVTFHLLVNQITTESLSLNLLYKDQILIEAVNERNEKRHLRLLGDEEDRLTFKIDRGFYERSEMIQVKLTDLPVYVTTNWLIKPPNE